MVSTFSPRVESLNISYSTCILLFINISREALCIIHICLILRVSSFLLSLSFQFFIAVLFVFPFLPSKLEKKNNSLSHTSRVIFVFQMMLVTFNTKKIWINRFCRLYFVVHKKMISPNKFSGSAIITNIVKVCMCKRG